MDSYDKIQTYGNANLRQHSAAVKRLLHYVALNLHSDVSVIHFFKFFYYNLMSIQIKVQTKLVML